MLTQQEINDILKKIKENEAIGGETPNGGWVLRAEALETELFDLHEQLRKGMPEEEYYKLFPVIDPAKWDEEYKPRD